MPRRGHARRPDANDSAEVGRNAQDPDEADNDEDVGRTVNVIAMEAGASEATHDAEARADTMYREFADTGSFDGKLPSFLVASATGLSSTTSMTTVIRHAASYAATVRYMSLADAVMVRA